MRYSRNMVASDRVVYYMSDRLSLQFLAHPTQPTAIMKNIASSLIVASAVHSVALAAPAGQDESMSKRLENGLGRTPALGYNNWVCP
jgi:hypothetical protein